MSNLTDVYAIELYAECGEELRPVDLRHECLQVGDGHLVVVGNRVTQFHIVLGGLSQTRLETQHCLCGFVCLRLAEEVEHVRNVLHVLGADIQRVLVLVDVILLLAQREARLVLVHDVHAGVERVGIDVHGKESVLHSCAEEFGKFVTRLNSLNLCKGVLHGCYTFLIAACGVEALVVDVADLLLDRALLVLLGGYVLNEPVDLLEVVQSQFVERAEARILGCQGVSSHPSAASVLVEIVLRHGGGVEVTQGDTGCLLLTGASCHYCCHGNNRN